MPQSSSSPTTTYILLAIAVLLMPVGAMVGDTAQWILIGTSAVALFVCAYNINLNNRRTGR